MRSSLARGAAVGLLLGTAAAPVQAIGLAADSPADLDPHSLVLPGLDIPGDWELVDERSLKSGDQQLDLYHEITADAPGRIVGLVVARFVDVTAAAASLDSAISQANGAGRPGWLLDNLGDGPAVAFVYQVAETQVRDRFGFDQDALGETVMVRVDRYLLTIQVGGPASMLPAVDELATQLSDLQIRRVRDALAAASP